MSIVNFNLMWFRCYSKAKLESHPPTLRKYVQVALDATKEALIQPGLEAGERQAIVIAIDDLQLMEREVLLPFRKRLRRQNRTPTQQLRQK
jgi:hypothetical protein